MGTYEFSPHGQPHRFFDTWIERETVIHQVFELACRLVTIDNLTIIPILTGAGVFNTVLGQKLNKQAPNKAIVEVPVVARSYGAKTEPGSLEIFSSWVQKDLVDGRTVVIVDDIYDSGGTASDVTEHILEKFHPLDVQRAFLIRKSNNKIPYDPRDHFLFELPSHSDSTEKPLFFAGMGMDWNYRYRNLDRVIDINSGRPSRES